MQTLDLRLQWFNRHSRNSRS